MSRKLGGIMGEIDNKYRDLGGRQGPLGEPTAPETSVGNGSYRTYQNGRIYWTPVTGAHVVWGEILERYLGYGPTGGFLGFPLSDEEQLLRDGQDSGGRLSRFEGGTVYWSPASGAFEVHGGIRTHYESLGGPLGPLGYPLTDETGVPGTGIQYNDFQRGIIVWRADIGARGIAGLRLGIGQVRCGEIYDGVEHMISFPVCAWADTTPELITNLTVKVDGKTLVDNKRTPSGHGGTSRDVSYSTQVSPVSSKTVIYWKVSADDWDAGSANDYLGHREETLNIGNLWGTLGGNPPGVYKGLPAQKKGGDARSLKTLSFDYSISWWAPGSKLHR